MSNETFNALMREGPRSDRARELEESRDALAAAIDALHDRGQNYALIIAELVDAAQWALEELEGPVQSDPQGAITALKAAIAAASIEGFVI